MSTVRKRWFTSCNKVMLRSVTYASAQLVFIHNNLPPFKCCSSAAGRADTATASFPTNTGRRTNSGGNSARHRAHRRLRPATPLTHKKQKMCEHGSCTGYTQGCKQTGHSAASDGTAIIYTVFQKNPCDYVFDDNLNSKRPIVIIFGTVIT